MNMAEGKKGVKGESLIQGIELWVVDDVIL